MSAYKSVFSPVALCWMVYDRNSTLWGKA